MSAKCQKRTSVGGWGGKEPGGRHLLGIVKDGSDGVTHPGTNALDVHVSAFASFSTMSRLRSAPQR